MDSTKDQKNDGNTSEKYKEYKQKWDEERKKTTDVKKNMAFFTKILKSLKLNYKQFAERAGISQQLISWWLTSDDCKYSNIVTSFEQIGIDIGCHYEPLPDSKFVVPAIPEDNFSIIIDGVPVVAAEDPEQGLVINQVLAGNGKLRFLAEFIDGLGLDIRTFSEKIDSNYHVVYSWFKKDDIKISKINLVGDRYQQKVVWTLKSR